MGTTYSVRGRTVQGDAYQMRQRKDDKTGAPRFKADGSPMMTSFIALAVPKNDPQLPALMAAMDNEKKAGWPKGEWQHRDFATKIEDGDSREPNKKGKINADREGFPGCTIFKFGNGFAPKVVYWDAALGWTESIKGQKGPQVKIGDYCTIIFDVESNGSAQSPGMYMNTKTIAFEAEGAAIAQDVDYTSMLGTRGPGAVPPNGGAAVASAPPPVASPPPSTIAAPISGPIMLPAAKGVTYESYRQAGWTDEQLIANGMMAAPVAASPVTPPPPYDAYMATPAAPPPVTVAPPPVITPPPAPQRVMLPKAGGVPYDSFVSQGWSDAQLVEHGMMAA